MPQICSERRVTIYVTLTCNLYSIAFLQNCSNYNVVIRAANSNSNLSSNSKELDLFAELETQNFVGFELELELENV